MGNAILINIIASSHALKSTLIIFYYLSPVLMAFNSVFSLFQSTGMVDCV